MQPKSSGPCSLSQPTSSSISECLIVTRPQSGTLEFSYLDSITITLRVKGEVKLRLEESDMVFVGNGVSRAELISDLLLNSFQESVVVFVPVGTANAGEENEPPLLTCELHGECGFSRTFKGLNPGR